MKRAITAVTFILGTCSSLLFAQTPAEIAEEFATFRGAPDAIEPLRLPGLANVQITSGTFSVASGRLIWTCDPVAGRTLSDAERETAKSHMQALLNAFKGYLPNATNSSVERLKGFQMEARLSGEEDPPIVYPHFEECAPAVVEYRRGCFLRRRGWTSVVVPSMVDYGIPTESHPEFEAIPGVLELETAAIPLQGVRAPIRVDEFALSTKSILRAIKEDQPAGVTFVTTGNSTPKPAPLDASLAGEFFGLGYHEYWSQQYEEAEASLKQAAELNPTDARIWYYRGFVSHALGHATAARGHIAAAIRVHAARPHDAEVARCLERVQGRLRREINQALTVYRASSSRRRPSAPPRPELVADAAGSGR